MATIINNPPGNSGDSNGITGLILGLIVLAVGVWLFFAYLLPAISHMRIGTPQVQIPVTVPGKIDVNVTQPK